MRNMSYFCIVKLKGYIIKLLTMCLISLNISGIRAANNAGTASSEHDSIRISLLTCSPGSEVYSLYGHTAIRYTDYGKGIDAVVNYGVFSFNKPFFILRFIFGITDYEMGIVPYEYFKLEYGEEGRSVVQQELNLSAEEKAAIRDAIELNYQPQNRTYRYNYFYDNCTTRARDILINNMQRVVSFPGKEKRYPSYRELIHSFNEDYPWARFGNDILLGFNADRSTSVSEHQFLPFLLKEDFDSAVITNSDGTTQPLVVQSSVIVDCPSVGADGGFPLRPLQCAWIIFSVVAIITLIEALKRKKLWLFDTIMMVFVGCLGIVVFMMLFSEHPATSTNLQVLLLNPLPLFFVYRVAKNACRHKADKFWNWSMLPVALFFIGGFFQQYAEGMYVLALSLLVRSVWNIIYQKKYLSV